MNVEEKMNVVSKSSLRIPWNDSWRTNEWKKHLRFQSMNLVGFPPNQEDLNSFLGINFAPSQTRSYDQYCRSNDYKSNIEWYHLRWHREEIERQYSIENEMSHKEQLLFDVDNDSFPWYSTDDFLEKISYYSNFIRLWDKPCFWLQSNGKLFAWISPMKISPIDRLIDEWKSTIFGEFDGDIDVLFTWFRCTKKRCYQSSSTTDINRFIHILQP